MRATLGGGQWWTDRRWRQGHRLQRHVGFSNHHRLLDPENRRLVGGTLSECLKHLESLPLGTTPEHLVVLLHGLGRRSASLRGLGSFLSDRGFAVARLDYASTRENIVSHAESVQEVIAHLPGTTRVSFVTHSLGGLVARYALGPGWPDSVDGHRLAMLAPPSSGAVLAQRLDSLPFRLVLGPSGADIARGPRAPLPSIPFIVIAGRLRGEKGLNPLIEGRDDGVDSVEETKLEGAAAHHVVESLHTTIMDHEEARGLIAEFLNEK